MSKKQTANTVKLSELLCCPDCEVWFDVKYLDGFRLQDNEQWIECPGCSIGQHEKSWKKGKVINNEKHIMKCEKCGKDYYVDGITAHSVTNKSCANL